MIRKANRHVMLDPGLDAAITAYASDHGISFTAALSVLAVRALRDEGYEITFPADPETRGGGER